MSVGDQQLTRDIIAGLQHHSSNVIPLPGVADPGNLTCLALQMKDSVHRVRYVLKLREAKPNPDWSDPTKAAVFNPLKAAAGFIQAGNIDDAAWMLFLFVHFGKHLRGGWRYCREVYGSLGQGKIWDWQTVSKSPGNFQQWLGLNQDYIRRRSVPGGFGNHRKYVSIDAYSGVGTGMAVRTYVNWVMGFGGHHNLFQSALANCHGDGRASFGHLYSEMNQVVSFGRLARFDYLAMIGKLGISPIEPPGPYLNGATGPSIGAKLLFTGSSRSNTSLKLLERMVQDLDTSLPIGPFGMQILEDSLCNWQKSPGQYVRFWG